MSTRDDANVVLIESADNIDALNAEFYGKIQYPWPPASFERVLRPNFWADMIAQEAGRFGEDVLPRSGARIWVAGCGTNQALITALRFPEAQVVGSDLSVESLALCRRNADSVGAKNLELRNESLNHVNYREEFDMVICTGVIHHNADPSQPLEKLATALKPSGVMEMMVYNRYHRILSTAFQMAVRLLAGTSGKPDFDKEMAVARKVVDTYTLPNIMGMFLSTQQGTPDAAFADYLIQPVEYSYTVESLEELSASRGLEYLMPCANQFDKAAGNLWWNFEFEEPQLREMYQQLSDSRRWQVANLLLAEQSPMLWFYMQRKDNPRPRLTEQQVCEAFLDTRFKKVDAEKAVFFRSPTGAYVPGKNAAFPGPPPREPQVRQVLEALDSSAPLRRTLEKLGLPTTFTAVNKLRIQLATCVFPYLEAVR